MIQNRSNEDFYKNSLIGFNAKVLLELLFKDSEYETYPFGYESLFSRITLGINLEGEQNETLKRVRSMPDLLIISKDKKIVNLIEVKFSSNRKITSHIQIKEKIDSYDKYWNDLILVIIIPTGEYIYAQYISKLNLSNRKPYKKFNKDVYYFNLKKEFVPIYEIFPGITKESIEKIKPLIDNIKPSISRP